MTIPSPLEATLATRLSAARTLTDELFDIVNRDALYDRPIGERHRIVFYIGHVDAFDLNLLGATLGEVASPNQAFDRLFAFGIDPVGGGLPDDKPSDWPSLDQVTGYVRDVRAAIDRALSGRLAEAASQGKFDQIANVAIEHRLMHAETLAYMFHWLPTAKKKGRTLDPDIVVPPPHPASVVIPAGAATLGRNQGFGWDNEFPQTIMTVPEFSIDRHKVSNGAFLEFVNSGGYSNAALWSPADWAWRTERQVDHPAFWRHRDGEWYWRGMFGERPLPPHWPVFVSHAEASAYARWQGKRLPTEAEFHRAAFGAPDGSERSYPWGEEAPTARHGNFDLRRWDPTPVNAHPTGDSAFGVAGLVGNGWEWTATPFAPFEGFQPFPFYRGYSADFFDGKHYVMKGGSMRTASSLLRRSFRNWFQPHYPYIYAGFRCVRS